MGWEEKVYCRKGEVDKISSGEKLNRLANKAVRVTLTKPTYDTMTLKAQTALYTIGSPMRAL